MNLSLILGFAQAIALTLSIAFLTYVVVIVWPFLRRTPKHPGDSSGFDWHFLVPCRDEEAVIADTITYLRANFTRAHVWIVDDASDDSTADAVRECARADHAADMIHLVRRHRPEARTGKGDALNSGYRALKDWLGEHADPDRTITIVVDADGRPAPNCLDACAGDTLFGNPTIGAVQVDVRMINRSTGATHLRGLRRKFGSLLVRMQDLEFRTAISAIQLARGFTGTICLGGNGQFSRLSALDSIAESDGAPWGTALLEDFELGIRLLTRGWKTGYSADTHVSQEGLYSMRRFLAQRTRWGQGTMQCARYVRPVWESPHLSAIGALEILYYLCQPWLQLLGTIVYPVPILLTVYYTIQNPHDAYVWFTGGAWILFLIYGLFGLLPFLIWGPIYRGKCEHSIGRARSLVYGCVYACYIYTFYITSWRAAIRLLRGRNGWAKTRRNSEVSTTGPVAVDH